MQTTNLKIYSANDGITLIDQKGFTLIELMVVIILVGVLSLAITQVPDPGLLEVREARRELAIELSGGILQQINQTYGVATGQNELPTSGAWAVQNGALIKSEEGVRHPFFWIQNDGHIHYALNISDVDDGGTMVRTAHWNLYDAPRSEKPFASFNLTLGKTEVPQ